MVRRSGPVRLRSTHRGIWRRRDPMMRILVGCEMTYELPHATPMIATLNVHSSRVSDLERPGLPRHDAVRADRGLSRQLRQLVQPARRAGRPLHAADRHGRARPRPLGSGRPGGRAGRGRRTCRPTRSCSCSAAATARPTSCPISPGSCSAHAARLGARQGDLRLRPRPHHLRLPAFAADAHGAPRPSRSGAASAATTRISPSRSAAASTSRPATARATSATSACRCRTRRAISRPGWRCFSAGAGTCSIRATTIPASAAS